MIDPQIPTDEDEPPSDSVVRAFAGLCCGLIAVLAGWQFITSGLSTGAWIRSMTLLAASVLGMARPAAIRPIFIGLVALTKPIGQLVSVLLLAVVYYGFVTPMAWFFRITGRDLLRLRRPHASTYWQPKLQPEDPRRYLRPYQGP
ncbi:MAG TPA: hypothetical protein VNM92_15150 [Thermoanaerobaculia bacterium]|nr:hypothetical protein [Thermoanaerobaculia bacterium]